MKAAGLVVARRAYRTPPAAAEWQRAELRRLVAAGAVVVEVDNPDLLVATNVVLSQSLRMPGVRVVLMLDDDIVFQARDAVDLVEQVSESQCPTSARYARADGSLIAAPWGVDRWLTGLGFLAMPAAALQALASESREFFPVPGSAPAWLLTMPQLHEAPDAPGLHWRSEDFALTARLGGVALSTLVVGHWKQGRIVYPTTERSA